MEVSPTRYRFRLVNGCNSRVLRLKFLVDRADESDFDDDCDGNRPGRQREREAVKVHVVSSDGQAGEETDTGTGMGTGTHAERNTTIKERPIANTKPKQLQSSGITMGTCSLIYLRG